MKKIILTFCILLFSSVIVLSEEKKQCSKLKLGKEYFKCLKDKMSGATSSKNVSDNSGKNWYQKLKEGKPLLSK